ncbi:MAG: hypothetical protein H0X08_00755 [Blastocatellia bacterium]|nr:hypothetical protein [Blastocatellia bacterium]
MKRTSEDRLLNPRPGSRIAEARDYGIDLTLIVENLRLTPEKRLEKLQQAMMGFEELRRVARPTKSAR